jgi:hypothetical protein
LLGTERLFQLDLIVLKTEREISLELGASYAGGWPVI